MGTSPIYNYGKSLALTTMRINLRNCDFGRRSDDEVKLLCAAMENNKSVKVLNLEENSISDVGAFALSAMLMSNENLESLNLYFNEIGNLGCSAFGEALKANGSRSND